MAEPRETLWPLDPHTKGKHLLLAEYLKAWIPIMGLRNDRVLFIDGFAGPGRYLDGEDGSPLIALKAWATHAAKDKVKAEMVFQFIEKDAVRAAKLQEVLREVELTLPKNTRVGVEHGVFDGTMTAVLNYLAAQKTNLAPAFVMVDPFGVSDTPMEVMKKILANPKSELFISFMYEAINRFKTQPEFEKHLDRLFGTPDWRDGLDIQGQEQRKEFFYGLYARQLKAAGAQFVLRFELYQGNRLVYAIFFATRDSKGCDKMKQAMWKVAPFGEFEFRGTRSPQISVFFEADIKPLQQELQAQFGGKGWLPIDEVIGFVASDATDYHTGHLKKGTLKPMEAAGLLAVREGTRKQKGSYPAGCELKFIALDS